MSSDPSELVTHISYIQGSLKIITKLLQRKIVTMQICATASELQDQIIPIGQECIRQCATKVGPHIIHDTKVLNVAELLGMTILEMLFAHECKKTEIEMPKRDNPRTEILALLFIGIVKPEPMKRALLCLCPRFKWSSSRFIFPHTQDIICATWNLIIFRRYSCDLGINL